MKPNPFMGKETPKEEKKEAAMPMPKGKSMPKSKPASKPKK